MTRADVALAAGTSTAVVSYVLNDGPRPVAPATRRRVLEAVAATGYRPDSIARALASGATRTLGLIVPDLSNPFFTALGHSLEDVASNVGLVFLLGDSAEDAVRQEDLIQSFISRRVDGLVVVPVDEETELSSARDAGIPVVLLDRTLAEPEISTVGIDNVEAARVATEHLIGHGRTDIGLVSGPSSLVTAEARAQGWEVALRSAGLPVDPRRVHRTGFDRRGGYLAGLELFSSDVPVDAVFVASEQQAVGLLRAAHERGTRVPTDTAVVAVDGTEASEYCVPSLSTISQRFDELASHALELVRVPRSRARSIVCDFDLVRRASCGCTEATSDQGGSDR
ncbi:LacI family DNA-binding transcriptional regulator [Brachybacterium sacelli]|uniref:LacI family transcriptional regulator n=1 Tax=Brachybacterium sacelli TaxID=173364 RepID=A0ABS4WYT2_9MICO|nr:LacI family transcriptional regulator [Brachybacterium sacelli]